MFFVVLYYKNILFASINLIFDKDTYSNSIFTPSPATVSTNALSHSVWFRKSWPTTLPVFPLESLCCETKPNTARANRRAVCLCICQKAFSLVLTLANNSGQNQSYFLLVNPVVFVCVANANSLPSPRWRGSPGGRGEALISPLDDTSVRLFLLHLLCKTTRP